MPEPTQQLVDTDGAIRDVPESQVAAALASKWRAPTIEDTARLAGADAAEHDFGGAAGAAKAILYGAARGATVGLSDPLFRAGGAQAADLRGYAAQNPRLSVGAELAGALLPSLVLPESLAARTPAGAVGEIGKTIAGAAERAGYGTVKKALASTAGAAIEGSIYGGGSYLSQVAIEDKPLAAESFLAAMGKGALWAAPVGGALSLGEGALVRARSLFPRSEITRQAARAVDQEATAAISKSVRDGDSMVEIARRRIDMADAQAAQAQAGERAARTMFGDASPKAGAEQVSAGLERQQIADAVDEYAKSRTALHDWVRSEADPDLEAALARIQAPDIQVGAPRLRVPEFGEVVPGSANNPALGEFGLERTSVGRRGARGTPVGAADATSAGGLPALPLPERPAGLPEIPTAPAPAAADVTRVGRRALADGTPVTPPPHAPGGEIPAYDAIKAHEAKVDDALEQTVSARSIADRGYYEPAIKPGRPDLTLEAADPVRMANARRAIAEGQREAIDLTVSPDGAIAVTGGRHRLAAAIEADAPIKVKWSTGAAPAADDVLRGGARAAPIYESAGDDLEALLRGTKERLTAGDSLSAMGAPARAEYAAAKAVRTRDAADHFRAEANARNFAGSDMGAAERAARDAVAVAVPSEDVARTIVDKAMRPSMRQVVEEDAIDRALRKHAGKNVDIGADLTRAAKVINDHEAATAKLADVLGADAPVTAVTSAKAYRAAIAAQADASAASAAQAAGDLASKVRPALAADSTMVDGDIARALRKHESAAAVRAARDAKAAGRAVDSLDREQGAAPVVATGGGHRARGLLGLAADAGTALEVLHAMGVHTPDLGAIPVIGPVLSLYLKARAVLGVLGRHGGSVGRSTESVVAAKAAAVRDRVTSAAHAALEVGAAGARAARPVAGPVGALAYRLFPGDGDTKSKDQRVLFDARAAELARAQAPGAIAAAVSDRVHTSDPALHDAITAQAERITKFLASKLPGQGMLQSMVPGDGAWHPSRTAIEEFARYVAAAHDPAGVLEDLARGHVSKEGAEVLAACYPALFAQAQRDLLTRASEIEHTLPYARRISISLMYRVPVDRTMSAAHLQYLRPPEPPPGSAGGPSAAPPPATAPAIAGQLDLGQQTMTSLERRAGA